MWCWEVRMTDCGGVSWILNRFLLGDSQGAKDDFEKSLDLVPEYVQSLVKVASVHMELG